MTGRPVEPAPSVDATSSEPKRRTSSLTPHEVRRLSWACRPIKEAFGVYPYLVGSALSGGEYRDVDVRLILDDDDFRAMFAGRGDSMARLRLVNAAVSLMIQQASGLSKPVDFQVQPMTYANEHHDGQRNPLGMTNTLGGFDAPDWSEVVS